MTFFKCPNCGQEVASNSKIGGPFEMPPTVVCVCDEGGAHEMEVVEEGDIDMDKVSER